MLLHGKQGACVSIIARKSSFKVTALTLVWDKLFTTMRNARPGGPPIAPAPIKLVLLHDRRLLAETLAITLGAVPDFQIVRTLTDFHELSDVVQQDRPDLLVIDYYTLIHRDRDGIVPAAMSLHPTMKWLVLIQHHDDQTLAACARAGAAGYVTSDSPPEHLIQAIRDVHNGEVLFKPRLLMRLLTSAQSDVRTPSPTVPRPGRREVEVLQAMASGASTEEAAAQLNITVHTVRTHLKNTMTKLQVHSKLEAVVLALRLGLIELPNSRVDTQHETPSGHQEP
jgi:DNA-binding NarL/FixJ family response regulator